MNIQNVRREMVKNEFPHTLGSTHGRGVLGLREKQSLGC